ncbi:MAG: hypothetical protein AAB074_19560 [Planctomycetota bacterium]
MILSFRLPSTTRSRLLKLVRQTGKTQSALIREALDLLARASSQEAESRGPYEAIAHLVGCVRGGPPDLSAKTGAHFRRILQARRRKS